MYRSTPATRAAKRDYWNRQDVAKWCERLDYAGLCFLMTALMLLGSISPR